MRVFQLGRGHVADPSHGLQGRLVEEGRLPVHHFDYHDAQRPDVHLGSVRQARNDLRGHPVGRSHQGLAFRQFLRYLGAEPEVRQLHPSVTRQQNGVAFYVSVNYTLRMQVRQCFQALSTHGSDLLLVHSRVSHDVCEGAAFQELHDDPQLVLDEKRVVHFDDVGVVVVPHDDDLVEQELPTLLFAKVHLLHRYLTSALSLAGDADDASGSFSDLDEVVQVEPGITWTDYHLKSCSKLFVG